jgi:phosphohistidine phosphatase
MRSRGLLAPGRKWSDNRTEMGEPPTMRLILFRHGPAGQRDAKRWPDDGKRPVTRSGRERTVRAAAGLRRLIGRVARVATSPLTRAKQTAELLVQALETEVRVETLDSLAPGAPHRETLKWLREVESGASVVLVGHEPHLGKLAGMLLFNSVSAELPLKKAGAVWIDFIGPVEPGAGRLRAFLPPRVLRRLAGGRSEA